MLTKKCDCWAINKLVAIEMVSSLGWERYTGDEGTIIAIDQFGASCKGDVIDAEYGFTVENIVSKKIKINDN